MVYILHAGAGIIVCIKLDELESNTDIKVCAVPNQEALSKIQISVYVIASSSVFFLM